MITGTTVRSVSWLVDRITAQIAMASDLSGVIVEGEVSNFRNTTGHWYFSLKDQNSRIDCAMWRSSNLKVGFVPKDGDRVIVGGTVTVYKVQGKVQLTVSRMKRAGQGDLKAMFDALFRKLNEEGLFDPLRKKPLPAYPMHIALVTGSTTHARADVYNTLKRRWPAAKVSEFPALVQGENAPPELIRALKSADACGADVVLLCRGGGSAEDLWCFNDEALVRTIYAMHTPVVTGVGHEPDHTLVDYVADVRAPTPTGAAEQATPDIREVREIIARTSENLKALVKRRISFEYDTLEQIKESTWYADPQSLIYSRRMEKDLIAERFLHLMSTSSSRLKVKLNEQKREMETAVRYRLRQDNQSLSAEREKLVQSAAACGSSRRQLLSAKAGLLDAYSPLKVLSRGYSVVLKDDTVIADVSELKKNDKVSIRMHNGSVEASVTEVTREDTNHGS